MSVFLATLKQSGLDLGSDYNRARFADWSRKNEGKTVRIELPEPKRTNQQNRYYWFYLELIERDTGNTANDLHDFFRVRFLPRRHVVIKGPKGKAEVEVAKSTTDLTKLEFGEYLEKICAATGVPLPDPVAAGYILN